MDRNLPYTLYFQGMYPKLFARKVPEFSLKECTLNFFILWATPSAAGPRSLLIALGLQILGIVATGSWHPCFPDLSFGMLGGLTLASCGSLGRSWDIGEHNNGHFEVLTRISLIFGGFRDPTFDSFLNTLDQKKAPVGVSWHAWRLYFGVLGHPETILG